MNDIKKRKLSYDMTDLKLSLDDIENKDLILKKILDLEKKIDFLFELIKKENKNDEFNNSPTYIN